MQQRDGVLIANRGEIAVRIVRACRAAGLRSIAVFSEADAQALHCELADHAVAIGPSPATESYLQVDAIVDAAVSSNASMVHPGYGFLGESPELARAVVQRGLRFVGPSAEVLELLGDKRAARATAARLGLATLEGIELTDGSVENVLETIGLPLLVKAAFGGGGRGMRIVREAAQLDEAVESAQRESQRSFGRPELFIEQLIERGRHVEVQILADEHGNVVDLGERDCTVQRRHQKVIEESPAPHLDTELVAQLRAGARDLARSVGYVGACTVEFLVDSLTGRAYFLEVNPRIQVEHTVSEVVTGIDIVRCQLAIAMGEPLGFTQDDVRLNGHAIEARINAEDPARQFTPMTGTVSRWRAPAGPFVRVDSAMTVGTEVTPYYDSMIGKVIAWGATRDDAIRRLDQALAETQLGGVANTIGFCRTVINHDYFRDAHHWTRWLDDEPPDHVDPDTDPDTDGIDEARPVVSMSATPSRIAQISTTSGVLELVIPTVGTTITAKRSAPTTRVSTRRSGSDSGLVAPMDATVVRFTVNVGDQVSAGQTVAVVESMKMESYVTAKSEGVVRRLCASPGESVKKGTPLVELDVNP